MNGQPTITMHEFTDRYIAPYLTSGDLRYEPVRRPLTRSTVLRGHAPRPFSAVAFPDQTEWLGGHPDQFPFRPVGVHRPSLTLLDYCDGELVLEVYDTPAALVCGLLSTVAWYAALGQGVSGAGAGVLQP